MKKMISSTTPQLSIIVGVSVSVIIVITMAVTIALIVYYFWWRRRTSNEGEKAENALQLPQQTEGEIKAETAFTVQAERKIKDKTAMTLQTIQVNHAVTPYISTVEPIPLEDFKLHVRSMHANNNYLFFEEYNNIEPNHAPTSVASRLPCNARKNRYTDIPSYDHSRVRLTEDPNRKGSDYINANYINGYHQPNGFIVTQGPNLATMSDLWRMVWEQATATIVMITKLEEKCQIKCHKYWPDKSQLYGRITVHVMKVQVLADYTHRTFSLQMSNSQEKRTVTQFQYTAWPDHGVPDYPTSLLYFVRKVMAINPENLGPIVVHCSAGVGRTGAFITLFSQLLGIEKENKINIFSFVRDMRYRRKFMVQTEPQYIFIHDALLEAIECGVTEVAAKDLQNQYSQLSTGDSANKKTGLAMEFERVKKTIHRILRTNTALLHCNRTKNRYHSNKNFVPYDYNRCQLKPIPGIEGSDYINASFVDGYRKRMAYITTQVPLPETQYDFWRMVWEKKCTTIVMLTKENEGAMVNCHRYWPLQGAEQYEQFRVISGSIKQTQYYIERNFEIVSTKDDSSLLVKQFQYTKWSKDCNTDTCSRFIHLMGVVQKWQKSNADRPVIIQCGSGCGRTGTYIAIEILIERLKAEGVVDVFRTVRTLRQQRPSMVRTEEQYKFCYKTTLEYLESLT